MLIDDYLKNQKVIIDDADLDFYTDDEWNELISKIRVEMPEYKNGKIPTKKQASLISRQFTNKVVDPYFAFEKWAWTKSKNPTL